MSAARPHDAASAAPTNPFEPTNDDRAALQQLARGGSFAAVGSAAGAALGLALVFVITHGLSPTSAGHFFSATAVFLVLQTLLAFGVGAGLVRFVPRYQALDRSADIPTLLRIAIVPVLVSGAVGSVLMWSLSGRLAALVAHDDPSSLVSTFHLVAALFLPSTLEIAAVECTRAFGSIRKYVLLQQVGVPLLRPLLVGTGIALGLPLWVLVLLWIVPLLVALAISSIVVVHAVRRLLGPAWRTIPPAAPARAVAREYWSFTAARGTAMVMDIILTWLDVVLVASIVSAAQAAIYAAASRFITAGSLVLQALRLALATDMSAALARRDLNRVSEMYRTATQWVVLASWPAYLLMASFAPTVLRIFGSSYSAGSTAMTILCAAMLVNLAAGNVGTVLLMGGKGTWVLADKTTCVVINVVLNLILIPRYGISGAALAWAVTIVVDSALAFTQVRRGMNVAGRLNGVALAAGLAVMCFGVVGFSGRLAFGSSLATIIGSALLGTTLYVLPLVHWRRALGLDVLSSVLRSGRAATARGGTRS